VTIVRRRHNGRYASLPNAIFEDDLLSVEAKGTLGYLLSRPPNWHVSLRQVGKKLSIGKDRLHRIFGELIQAGYASREQPRRRSGAFGRFEYVIRDEPETPVASLPQPEKPLPAQPAPAQPVPANKAAYINKTESTKTDLTKTEGSERGNRPTRISTDFDLDDETRSWALKRLGREEAVSSSVDRFRDHYLQVAGSRGLSCDWQRKARLWIDSDAKTVAQSDNGRPRSLVAAIDRQIAKIRSFDAGASEVIAGPTDAEWDSVLTTYRKIGRWTKHVESFGNDPTSPNCRAPHHLLLKHSLALGQAQAPTLADLQRDSQ